MLLQKTIIREVITMRRQHPLWRGFWLALSMAAVLFLLGPLDPLSPYRLERNPLVFFAAMTAGAFIGALPGRLQKGSQPSQHTTWQRCLRAFLCGAAMALGLGMAGDGAVIPALMTGSVGAYAFCAAALFAGFITVRIAERRRSA